MVTTVGGVKIEIRGENSPFTRSMREVEQRAGRTSRSVVSDFNKMDGAAAKLNASIKSTATSMLALTAAFGVGAGLAGGVRIIANFSQAMATLKAITGGTVEEIAKLEATARQLGSTTKYSASQAADAMTELARAGFDTNQVLAAIPSVLSLATAGGVELASAAEITGVTLAQFGLQAAEAARVADVLAEAANRSNVGVTDLGEALKYAGPTGKALGLDLEQTVAVLAALGDGGLKGGQGGRGFGSIGVQLVNMREEITALIGTYDIAAEGIQGVVKRMVEAGITTEQVIAIFRGENIDTFNILASAATSTTKSIDDFVVGLKGAEGSSARVAKVMADNLNGAIQAAASAFEELNIALGKAGAEAAILNAVKGLTALMVVAARNADVLGVAVVAMTARAIIPLVASAIPAAITALRNLAGSLLFVQGAAARTALTMSALGGPLTLAIAGAAAAYLVLARNAATAEERIARANEVLGRADAVLQKTQGLLSGDNSPLKQVADQAEDAVGKVVSLTDAVDSLQKGLANLRQEGQIATALEIGQSISEVRLEVERLQQAREAAGRRAFNAPNLGGRAGLQRNIDRELERFDSSEEGQQLLFARQKLAALESRLKIAGQGLTIDDLIGQFREGSPATAGGGGGGSTKPAEIDEDAADRLTEQLQLLSALEREQALRLAIAAGNQELVDILETRAEIEERAQDLAATGFFTIDQARLKAEQDITEEKRLQAEEAARLAGIEQRTDELRLNLEERDLLRQEAEEAAELLRDRIADSIAYGLEGGIRSGNWGEAFRSILADNVSSAMADAINDLADQLVNLFSGLLDGAGSSVGSGIASLFSFGGGRAAGGPVKAGMRYMVGEQGPEMFVPGVPGMVLPKAELPASAAAAGVTGAHVINVAPQWHVHGSITEEVLPRVQQMFAEQARHLPRIIDSQVKDSTRRGRY